MKKILLMILSIGVVAVVAVYATQAFFSDTETSTGNTFTAGSIDLKIDYAGYYNRAIGGQPDVQWSFNDLSTEKFFNFSDIKPGDFGEGTISLHVFNNDAWACITIDQMTNDDNGLTEPESIVDATGGAGQGELANNLFFTAWIDDGNNIWDEGEPLLFANEYGPASDVLNGRTYALADSTTGYGPIKGGQDYYIGIKWCAGAMDIIQETGVIACDGSAMDNASQTDSVTANVTFYVEQSRNNPGFRCLVTEPALTTLILENKDQEYNRLTNEGIYAELVFNPSAATFDYDLKAYGLAAGSTYKLIYYADPWAGNHPGALIGMFLTNGSGEINETGQSYNFGYDLPNSTDANYLDGAKIWLIPGAVYH